MMTMQRSWQRTTILSSVAAAATVFLAAAPAGAAGRPSSSIEVNYTTVEPGDVFTVTQTIHNRRNFTVTNAKPSIYGTPRAIADVVDVDSCIGTTVDCYRYGSSYRAPIGDLPGGETETVVFFLRVKDTAAPGQFTLRHQFVGDNYAFEILDGPVITVTPPTPANPDDQPGAALG